MEKPAVQRNFKCFPKHSSLGDLYTSTAETTLACYKLFCSLFLWIKISTQVSRLNDQLQNDLKAFFFFWKSLKSKLADPRWYTTNLSSFAKVFNMAPAVTEIVPVTCKKFLGKGSVIQWLSENRKVFSLRKYRKILACVTKWKNKRK